VDDELRVWTHDAELDVVVDTLLVRRYSRVCVEDVVDVLDSPMDPVDV